MSILGRLAQLSPMIDGIMLPPRRTPTSEPEANFEEPTVENLERLKQQSAGAAAVETTEPAFTPPVTTVLPVEKNDSVVIDPLEAEKVALEAVREIITLNEIAQKYAVHPIQVRQWKKELLDNAEMAFKKEKNNSNNYEVQESKLHEQIGRLSVENDWLKKKLGI